MEEIPATEPKINIDNSDSENEPASETASNLSDSETLR